MNAGPRNRFTVAGKLVHNCNFGLIYGLSPNGFREYARIQYGVFLTEKEAHEQHSAFFRLYANLTKWHREYREKARDYGYVTTLHGRRRRLNDVYSREDGRRAAAERQAINSPIQGSGGEFTIFAACILQHRLKLAFGDAVRLVNTVHDSLIFYVREDLLKQAAELIKQTCENPGTRQYWGYDMDDIGGMKVDLEVGDNWKDLKPLEV